ncbi:nuclear transport factor 2 family protein [Edaphobacter aggregans]|uniref:nuclear transport factor 2 family protein n=1 Tax=Edaphobacter aggregans TaxID=570835 RepID=UPI000A03B0FC|nr:nuclear transport factor 2 family protein [Edaphobacter aggregans]
MFTRNTPQKILESWKQIAGYLERSERTVRRWEASEGLPVHRRGHEKQDTVFAYRHEIDVWSRSRTKCPGAERIDDAESLPPVKSANNGYLVEHDAITRTMHCYIAGARAGDSNLMHAAFYPWATISGFCQGVEYSGSVKHVFDWITENGPAPNIEPRFARIEIIETIAVVHLEVQHWSGKLAGANARASDVFTLLKRNGEWKITHKLFHWHDQ